MKYRLLDLLACSKCGESFEIDAFELSQACDGEEEVEQGLLRCL